MSFCLSKKPHKIRLFCPQSLVLYLHFLKVDSNRHFCRFWGENREDRGEKTEEGNTKNMHRRTELQTDKIYVRGVSNEKFTN